MKMKSMIRFPRMLAAGAALATGLLIQSPASAQYQQQGQQGGRWEQGQRQRQDPGQRLDRQVSMLTQRLRLSSSQASQIRGILQRQDEQFQAYRQSHQGEFQRGGRQQGQGGWQQGQRQRGQERQRGQDGQRERRQLPAELQAIRTRSEQQIERVLNDSQRAEYRRLRDERGQWANGQRGEGRGQRNGGQNGQWQGSR
jgi:hypothetical protein